MPPNHTTHTKPSRVWIWDLDGVLADSTFRLERILGIAPEDRDWPAFYQDMEKDLVYEGSKALLNNQIAVGDDIVFFTGRSQNTFSQTWMWIHQNIIPVWNMPHLADRIHMRPDEDCSPAFQVKGRMLDRFRFTYPDAKILGAFEDDPRCLAMYRERNIPAWDPGTWVDGV